MRTAFLWILLPLLMAAMLGFFSSDLTAADTKEPPLAVAKADQPAAAQPSSDKQDDHKLGWRLRQWRAKRQAERDKQAKADKNKPTVPAPGSKSQPKELPAPQKAPGKTPPASSPPVP